MSERDDLGARLARVTRRLVALEQPVLDKHGMTMWEYVALLRLRAAPAQTQLELSRTMGYDKTRLIVLLDGLQHRGLITRKPAPNDRRARIITLSHKGRAQVDAVQREIHQMEDQLLTTSQLQQLHRLLDRL